MEQQERTPIGTGHASAMFRQGLAELRAAMYPESNVAQPAQYGIYGTRTPGEVMQDKQAIEADPDERPSVLDQGRSGADMGEERREREAREPERD